MRTVPPETSRTVWALPLFFLYLTSLIGCTALHPSPVIDRIPPDTPKGFVEFYIILGDYFAGQEGKYCYNLPKARPEYSNLYFAFAVQQIPGGDRSVLVQDPKLFRPGVPALEFDLPNLWRRIAMAPGEYNFIASGGRIVLLEPVLHSSSVTVKVTEGMITPVRLEAKCLSEKKAFGKIEFEGLFNIILGKQIPVTSNERTIALFKELLKDRDWTVRFYAARILGEIGDPNTVELLIDALKDDIWEVKMQAGFSLMKFKDVRDLRIVDLLTAGLIEGSKEKNLGQISNAARILGEIGDERAIEPLERCLDQKYDPLYRENTIRRAKTKCSDALKKIRQRLKK
jgi:hypothetical protein